MNTLKGTQQSCNSGRLSPRLEVPQYWAALGGIPERNYATSGSSGPLFVTNMLVAMISEYRLRVATG